MTTKSTKKPASKKPVAAKSTAQAGASKSAKAASAAAAPKKKLVKKAAAKPRVSKTIKVKQSQVINYQTRYQMIQEAAYLIAEKQNFSPDNELDNWLQAESQIDNWIATENIQLTT